MENKELASKSLEAGQENKKREEENRKKYLQYFIRCRDNYIDEIPDQIIYRSEDPEEDKKYYFYKCKKSFFTHLVGRLGLMVEMKIIKDIESINKINEFIKYVKENIILKEKITKENKEDIYEVKKITKEDIDKANEIIDYAIEILS